MFSRRVHRSRIVLCSTIFFFVMVLSVLKNGDDAQTQKCDTKLLDLGNFEYLIENDICSSKDVFMIVLIHSSPTHTILRNALRIAIKLASLDLKLEISVAFLLARVQNKDTVEAIAKENSKYKDIIQGNFVDAYRNLTYKHAMGLKWASEKCGEAKFVMKMDDDIFIDFYKLSQLIQMTFSNMTSQDIICNVFDELTPDRNSSNKWFVTHDEYEADLYPTYCSGWVEIMSPQLAYGLSTAAEDFKPFWIDDIFMTGMVASMLNITFHDLDWRVTSDRSVAVDWMMKIPFKNFDFNFMVAPIGRSGTLLEDLHAKARDCYFLGCPSIPFEKWEELRTR